MFRSMKLRGPRMQANAGGPVPLGLVAVLGTLLVLSPGLSVAADGRTILPPPGDYKVVFLVLEKGGLTIKPTWGTGASQHKGDLYIRGRVSGRQTPDPRPPECASDCQ